jgi:putative restriction endonuclease
MDATDLDRRLRAAVFAWLDRARARSGGDITYRELQSFTFDGVTVPLLDRASRGIHSPKLLGNDRAALTLLTAAPKHDGQRPYDDDESDDADYWIYRYQRAGPDTHDNQLVRRAHQRALPLVYFRGLAKGIYEALYPVFVTHDDRVNESFHLAADSESGLITGVPTPTDVAAARRYATRAAKVRLHQAQFRERVLTAYQTRCTVCRIKHRVLLDAAHITPDAHVRGAPEVTNGLSLCKIHHAAYDAHLLGVSPDYHVQINRDLLYEIDGPMLKHGLVELHQTRITLPKDTVLHPDKERLSQRFELFQQK